MMPLIDPMWLLTGLMKVYALALVLLVAGCAAAVVIVSLFRDSLGPAGDPPPR